MPERKIDPKFNIHETYRRVNIVNPYRHGSGGGSTYEPETIDFMEATSTPDNSSASVYTGLTNHDCWVLLDSVIKYYKDNNQWDEIVVWHPMFGGTATKCGFNVKDTSLFNMTFNGSWVIDATGNKGNGSNTYGDSLFIPFDNLVFNNMGLTLVFIDNTQVGIPVGGNQITSYRTYLLGGGEFVVGDTSSSVTTPGFGNGIFTGTRTTSLRSYMNGVLANTKNTVSGDGLSKVASYYGARNNYNIMANSSTSKLADKMYHTGDIDPAIIAEGLRMWNQGLGRKTW